ncbi:ATP-dependent nuclease [Microbulbifer spongiae]|uniref:ATP-binding protein n=1 Tax=Microbulbifer spongiae TaxID=2944933 RepID=A0ABY9E7P9_9GAMM|nr:AAA family ATPase [Microbulbifer sp. MI-G]WKD48356.1 ATP-binding protein [Microbulbifer sp. MI-G]
MDLINKNGYSLKKLNKINVVLGKNGCGKSTALKKVQQALESGEEVKNSKYITPERGGALKYDPSIEQNTVNNPYWLSGELRRNQFSQFKQQTVLQFRNLELLSLREIEQNPKIRDNHEYTFQSIVDAINTLLDNIEIRREGSDFNIYNQADNSKIEPDAISSGESELIALGIECLVFAKESVDGEENILFLDEPDAHLHPDLQVRLAMFLRELVEENNFKVVMATHSTSFLAAFESYPGVSIEFILPNQTEIDFKVVSETYRRILPIFGAHPLSNLFNESPILLVEGEDDERIWQQAIRTSKGSLKIYPCAVDSIDQLNKYETQVSRIINSIYDSAKAFSLRDRDDGEEDINDTPPVVRMRLSCRAAENLLLADESLAKLEIDWETLKSKIEVWISNNDHHSHHQVMATFRDEGYDRKMFNLKKIRNDLMGIIESNKPWEVVVGQAIAITEYIDNPAPNSIQDYLGNKLVCAILKH